MKRLPVVLLAALLASCAADRQRTPRSEPSSGAATNPGNLPEDSIRALIRERKDGSLVALLHTPLDACSQDMIGDYFKRMQGGGDLDLLRKSERAVQRGQGTFFVADVYVCRGDKRGLLLLGSLFEELEAGRGDANVKMLSGLRDYILRLTGRRFDVAAAFRGWLEDNMPHLQIRLGRGHCDDLPHVVIEDSVHRGPATRPR